MGPLSQTCAEWPCDRYYQEAKEERHNPLLSRSHSPEGRQVTCTYLCIYSHSPCHFLKDNMSKFKLLLFSLYSYTPIVSGTFMSLTLSFKCLPCLVPFHLNSLLASCGYSNKLLPTWQPKMTEIYSHSPGGQKTEICITGLKSRFPSRGSEEETIPALLASDGFWLYHSISCLWGHTAFFSSVFIKPLFASLL